MFRQVRSQGFQLKGFGFVSGGNLKISRDKLAIAAGSGQEKESPIEFEIPVRTRQAGDLFGIHRFGPRTGNFGTELAGVRVAGIGGDDSGRVLGEDDLEVGFTMDVKTRNLAGERVRPIAFETENLGVIAGLVGDLGVFENSIGIHPVLRSGEISVE